MKLEKIKYKIMLCFLLLIGFLFTKIYTFSGSFLEMDFLPQSASKSGSYSTTILDPNVSLYNPGGLAFLQSSYLTLSHATYPCDTFIEYMLYANVIKKYDVKYAIITEWMHSFFDIYERNNERTGESLAQNWLVNLSLAKLFFNNIMGIGINVKYINMITSVYYSKIIAIDTGFTFNINENITFAVALRNLGVDINNPNNGITMIKDNNSANKKVNLPLNLKIGTGYNIFFKSYKLLCINMDINKYPDVTFIINTGINLFLFKNFSLNFGYKINNNINSFSYGFEYKFKIKETNNIIINYAYIPFYLIGGTHHFAFSFRS